MVLSGFSPGNRSSSCKKKQKKTLKSGQQTPPNSPVPLLPPEEESGPHERAFFHFPACTPPLRFDRSRPPTPAASGLCCHFSRFHEFTIHLVTNKQKTCFYSISILWLWERISEVDKLLRFVRFSKSNNALARICFHYMFIVIFT